MSTDEFRQRMKYLYERVVGSEKAAGVDRIYVPGQIEKLTQIEREQPGIPLVQAEVDASNAETAKVRVKKTATGVRSAAD